MKSLFNVATSRTGRLQISAEEEGRGELPPVICVLPPKAASPETDDIVPMFRCAFCGLHLTPEQP